MIFSVDAEKIFDKIEHSFMIWKILGKLGIEGNILSLTMTMYKNLTLTS